MPNCEFFDGSDGTKTTVRRRLGNKLIQRRMWRIPHPSLRRFVEPALAFLDPRIVIEALAHNDISIGSFVTVNYLRDAKAFRRPAANNGQKYYEAPGLVHNQHSQRFRESSYSVRLPLGKSCPQFEEPSGQLWPDPTGHLDYSGWYQCEI